MSEELVQKQMKQMELSLGKLESELQHHKKPEQGDKFYEKMKVRWPVGVMCVLMWCVCVHV